MTRIVRIGCGAVVLLYAGCALLSLVLPPRPARRPPPETPQERVIRELTAQTNRKHFGVGDRATLTGDVGPLRRGTVVTVRHLGAELHEVVTDAGDLHWAPESLMSRHTWESPTPPAP